jgi:pyruvate ferredoxin oxidoreductase beta subunit
MKLQELTQEEYFASGHRACAGCGEAIAIRIILKVLGPRTIVVNPTGCIEIISTPYPENAWKVPYIHNAFENAAAVASGVCSALNVLMKKGKIKNEKINVAVFAGDGGTADIGLQALSGTLERRDPIIYICFDNEAYMNTGIQRSSSTPHCAWTTTSPPGTKSLGERGWKKDMLRIVEAHQIPYIASASIGYPLDLAEKVRKASILLPSYIHLHVPCPTGWRFESSKTLKVARTAVQSGMFLLYEIENGVPKYRKVKKRVKVEEYLRMQGRFRHLFDTDAGKIEIERMQEAVDRNMGVK